MISINSGLIFMLAVLALCAWMFHLAFRTECPECRRRDRDLGIDWEDDDD